jgi:hypothetical protein
MAVFIDVEIRPRVLRGGVPGAFFRIGDVCKGRAVQRSPGGSGMGIRGAVALDGLVYQTLLQTLEVSPPVRIDGFRVFEPFPVQIIDEIRIAQM